MNSEEIGCALCIGIANRPDQTADSSHAFWDELRTATQAEGVSGFPACGQSRTGDHWICLVLPDACPLLGTARLSLVPCSLVSAEAAAERQLVPVGGKGWENESATRGEGRNLLEESVCIETNSSFHMQVMCWFSYNCF